MSPLKSKAQMRKFGEMVKQGKMSQAEFDKWIADTPNVGDLPEKVSPSKITSVADLRQVAKIKKGKTL